MGLDKVKQYFRNYGLEYKIIESSKSSATVAEAAEALGCKEEIIAKTLSFIVNDNPILIVIAGDAKVDNKKYKAEFGVKAKMIKREYTLRLVGHSVGGVCPFAINEGVLVYLDHSLSRFETVFPACGSSNSTIALTIKELEFHSNYKVD